MEQIPVSSSSWEKRKLEHIFLTVRFKKLNKPMAYGSHCSLRLSLLLMIIPAVFQSPIIFVLLLFNFVFFCDICYLILAVGFFKTYFTH